ncbi:MAG: monovalent cation/H(+) antiporter subunit G [Alphaproteobacteria bacterium]
MSALINILSWILLIGGAFFILTGSIGLVRMPDFFSRTHPAGLIDTLGAALTIGGLLLQSGFTAVSIKLVLILVFLFLTGPTATHALAHAALISGIKPWTRGDTRKPSNNPPATGDET